MQHHNILTFIYCHHHKHEGLDPLILSVCRVTAARTNVSSVFQLFSFLAVSSGSISKGYIYIYIYIYITNNCCRYHRHLVFAA